MNAGEQLIAEGIERGRAEGIERGRAEGMRVALEQVLRARSIALSDVGRARIAACADVTLLTRWLQQATAAATESDVFAGESSASTT